MLFEEYVKENRPEFIARVTEIARALGINPSWLMALMFHESRLNHRAVNSIGCVGLIQFCPSGGLTKFGVSASYMRTISNVKQLDYVYLYFKDKAGQYKNYFDLHLYAFYPLALFKQDNFVIGSEQSLNYARLVASQNRPFDTDKDGYITISNFKTYLKKWLSNYNVNFPDSSDKTALYIALGLLAYIYQDEIKDTLNL